MFRHEKTGPLGIQVDFLFLSYFGLFLYKTPTNGVCFWWGNCCMMHLDQPSPVLGWSVEIWIHSPHQSWFEVSRCTALMHFFALDLFEVKCIIQFYVWQSVICIPFIQIRIFFEKSSGEICFERIFVGWCWGLLRCGNLCLWFGWGDLDWRFLGHLEAHHSLVGWLMDEVTTWMDNSDCNILAI